MAAADGQVGVKWLALGVQDVNRMACVLVFKEDMLTSPLATCFHSFRFRRKSLASLGSATGIYRTLVTYLVGVPQVRG